MNGSNFYVGQSIRIGELDAERDFSVMQIAEGGMGVCAKVSNGEWTYALKGMRRELVRDPESRRRFCREMDIWHACSACDGVVDAKGVVLIDDLPYMVSEWVSGGDLATRLPRMTDDAKVKMFVGIVDALRVVHAAFKTIHRDLKPQNILVQEPDRPLISDWGLAKVLDGTIGKTALAYGGSDMTVTASGMGTVLYMSPEQIIARPDIDFRADIYALGCMLYEFETGRPPFVGGTVEDILKRHLGERPQRLGGLFKKTALGMERIIERCLQKDPRDRYQSYDDLLRDAESVAMKRGVVAYHHATIVNERNVPGRGYDRIVKPKLAQDGEAIVSGPKVAAIIEEAGLLLQTGRCREAINLLRPFVNIENILSKDLSWHWGADMLEMYAHALMLHSETEEAVRCYHALSRFKNKPACYYVNASCLHLRMKDFPKVVSICEEGARLYPKDVDIAHNLSSARGQLGSALRREDVEGRKLSVYDCERLQNALQKKSAELRYKDLDAFSMNMQSRYSVISHGLSLNPSFAALVLMKARFISEIDENDGISFCESLLRNPALKGDAREYVLEVWIDSHVERAWFSTRKDVIVDSIRAIEAHLSDKVSGRCRAHIIDSYYMLHLRYNPGMTDDLSGIGKPLRDWFLTKIENSYRRPVEAAEVLVKIGMIADAIKIIDGLRNEANWRTCQSCVSILLAAGKPEMALEFARRGTVLMPQHREVWAVFATACNASGHREEASRARNTGSALWSKEQAILQQLRKLYKAQ